MAGAICHAEYALYGNRVREENMKRLFFTSAFCALAAFFVLYSSDVHAQVVVIGDSNIAGKGVAPSENYPSKLQRALRARGYQGRVTNAGINGDTTEGVIGRLDTDVPAGTRLAIVWVGINDIRRHGATHESVIANKQVIASRLRARGIKVIMLGPKYYPAGNRELLQTDRDEHLNAAGYDYLVTRTLPQVEAALGLSGKHR